ncbi:MAG: hypothetical protein LUH02_12135 [Erysipelotrichaceae bacterium]|nr:hypothetical protein [Erysipelotrichaceae bacterium]
MDKFWDDNDLINSAKKKRMLFVLAVDTSKYMNTKIEIVNKAIKETLNKLKDLDLKHNIAKVTVAILEFNKEATWLIDKPQEINNFNFNELKCTKESQSNYHCLYQQLNEKLTTDTFLKDAQDYYPIILLINDGMPTDDYEDMLNQCENNPWFHKATRIAMPIIIDKNMNEEEFRDSLNYQFIMDFTNQKDDRIFFVTKLEHLIDMLDIVTLTTVQRRNKNKKQQIQNADPFNDIRNKLLNL